MKVVIALVLSLAQGVCLALGFVAGKDYKVLPNAPKYQPGQPVAVVEFFSYGCPWCYQLSKPLDEFIKKQGKRVKFQKIPVVFQPGWKVYAKAYYAAKRLNKLDTLGPALFKAIQEENRKLDTDKAMVAFFVANGVDQKVAENAFYRSPTINSDVNQGSLKMVKHHVQSVPTVIVNGRFKLDIAMAGKIDRFFVILDYLITKETKQ